MNSNAAFPYRPLLELSDLRLLEMMKDGRQGNAALTEFNERYSSYIFKVCLKACESFKGGEGMAKDIVQQTLMKAYLSAGKFKIPDGAAPSGRQAALKAWLSRIARNELVSYLRANPDETRMARQDWDMHEDTGSPFDVPQSEEDVSAPAPSIAMDTLKRALALLSEKERHILITYMAFYDPADPNRHLPDSVINRICAEWKLKPGTVRQIKRRALQKIKEFSQLASS